MTDWKKIKSEYIRGGISYRKLAEKYNVSPTTLYRKMKSENWVQKREQTESKVEAKIAEAVVKKEVDKIDRVQNIADILLSKIEYGIASGDLIKTSKDLRAVTASIKDIRDIKGIRTDLEIEEQKARIAKLRKEAKEEEQDKTITVVMADGLDLYSE